MFPTAHSTVYYNEAGEPLGWSDESYYEPDPDDFYDDRRRDAADNAAEEAWELITEQDDDDLLAQHSYEDEPWKVDAIHDQLADRRLAGDPDNCDACMNIARRRLIDLLTNNS